MEMKYRDIQLDILKGLGIIFVVLLTWLIGLKNDNGHNAISTSSFLNNR